MLLVIGAGLLGAAIVEELLKSPDERTWEGRIGGLIPYDLRLATREGLREAMDRPEEARVVLGTKAVQVAAEQIMLGNAEVAIAGGMENMSRTPYLLDRMRGGYRMGAAEIVDGMYRDGFLDPLSGYLMGETAENLARRYGITREEQDEFAFASQRKAEEGNERRAKEIVGVEAPGRKG